MYKLNYPNPIPPSLQYSQLSLPLLEFYPPSSLNWPIPPFLVTPIPSIFTSIPALLLSIQSSAILPRSALIPSFCRICA